MTRWAPQDAAKATLFRLEVQPVKRAEGSGGIESLRLSEIFELLRISSHKTGRTATQSQRASAALQQLVKTRLATKLAERADPVAP